MNSLSQRLNQAQPSVPQMSPEGSIGLQSHSINELVKAKAAADILLRNVRKGSANPFFNSEYADLDAITRIVRPIYGEHGMAFVQAPWVLDGKDVLITTLAHESGQWIRSVMTLNALSNKDSVVTPQAVGSAITYAKRYSLAAMANLAQTNEDDDGEAAMAREPAPPAVVVDDIADTLGLPPPDTSFDYMEKSLNAVSDSDNDGLKGWFRDNEDALHQLEESNEAAFEQLRKRYKEKKGKAA